MVYTLTYPTSTSGYRLKLAYEYQYGHLSKIKDDNDPTTVPWQLNALDAAGRVLDETLGAGVRVVTGFNTTSGRIATRQAGVGGGTGIQNLSYQWDVNDNLIRRQDDQQSPQVFEYFFYDSLDRIDYSVRNGGTNLDVSYDALGNVTAKSDVGSYTYDATKIHAVTTAGSNTYSYDANGNVTSRNGSPLLWTSYDLPSRIDNGTGTTSYLWYGPDRRLWRQQAYSAGAQESTTYVGELVEKVTKDGITTWKHYVEAPTGTAAVYLRRSDGTASTYYLTHDHLGSTDKVLDAQGAVLTVAESFTALGARRGSNWQGTPSPSDLAAIAATTRDGFTGHVMLDNLGLVHMQGRVYDPVLGRFLSVDPIVRDPGAAQSWNGYGYVEGRVVSAIDPTGYSTKPLFSLGNVTAEECQRAAACVEARFLSLELSIQLYLDKALGDLADGFDSSFGLPNQLGNEDAIHDPSDETQGHQQFNAELQKLADCAAEHYGLDHADFSDNAAVEFVAENPGETLSLTGATPWPKPFVTPGSSEVSNVGSRIAHSLPRISMGRSVLGTASALRLVARMNLALAVGFLAYDATSIAMCMAKD